MGIKLSILKKKEKKKNIAAQKQKGGHFANVQQFARKSAKKLEQLAEVYNATEAMGIQFPMLRVNSLWVELNSSLEFSYYIRGEKRTLRRRELNGVRIIAKDLCIDGYLTEKLCEELANFLYKANWGFVNLKIGYICCSSDQLNRLVESSKAKMFICHTTVPREFFILSSLKYLMDLHVSSFLSDLDLLGLEMSKMHLEKTNISSFGIHRLIKEWLTGKRNISSITIETEQNLNTDLILDGIARSEGDSPDASEESYVVKKFNQGVILTIDEPYVFLRTIKI